ncbi:hypothetical protein ABW286_09375 [Erwinia papayae]|uniref:Glutamate racemase n=1 Tax=Erwinia papayae TaxID=206499 RepID=A0ABV3N0Q8_9GAMM
MTIIACLHAAESNIAVFEQALPLAGAGAVRLLHHVESELLARATAAGEVTREIAEATRHILQQLCQQADVVIVTCTTLGVVASDSRLFSKPVLRVDAVLAGVASRCEGHIAVLCTAPGTLASTRQLFETCIAPDRLSVTLVSEAWERFTRQDSAGYHQQIAASARQCLAQSPGCIVLAQSSMTGAEALFDSPVPVLTVPSASLRAALDAVT